MHGFRTKEQRGPKGESHGPSPNPAPPRVELEARCRTDTGEGERGQLIPGAESVVGDVDTDTRKLKCQQHHPARWKRNNLHGG